MRKVVVRYLVIEQQVPFSLLIPSKLDFFGDEVAFEAAGAHFY